FQSPTAMGKLFSRLRTRPQLPDQTKRAKMQKDFRSTRQLPDKTGFVFDGWVQKNNLNEATRAKLIEEDLTTRDALLSLTPKDIASLQLTLGQRKELENAVQQIKDSENLSQSVPATSKTGKQMVRALYDFKSAEENALDLRAGELMELLDDCGDWSLVKNEDGIEGYVPSSYIALENTIESMDWFFGEMSRHDAEQILRADTADTGSFLIRESPKEKVRGPPQKKNDKPVKHYKIVGNESEGYHISSKWCSTIDQLVNHFKDRADSLICALTSPCPRPKPVQQDLSKETEDDWEIDRSTLTFSDKPIGSGQFGEVWKGMWKGTTEVAIKTMKEDSMDADKFLAEAAIMKKFRHPHLVKLYAVCSKQEPFLIVTEFMRNGSLLDYLRTGDGRNCSLSDLMLIAAQNNFIHRDLAARNILVGELNVVKVADFGFARLIEEGIYSPPTDTKFPVRWTAPEVMFDNRCTIKSDVWSFGVLLHEIMTKGKLPYVGMSNMEVKRAVREGYHMDKDKAVPDEVYDVMLQCWNKDDDKRPSFATLLRFCLDCRIDGVCIGDDREDFDVYDPSS
ncbi:hypothetical protein BaRGS_00020827, partial [Batillaria attramentaria]